MGNATRRGRVPVQAKLIGTAMLVVALTACSSHTPKTSSKRSKEYFPESQYGVKASPRVSTAKSNLQRGGGRYQVGKPYKIKGKWFHPKEDPNYSAKGAASWYGDAFHGRLTANGEVYDMTHLTAAHPTLPLPSYARVTNLKNNSSVVVRINDRGPFAHGRVIDLSKRAAELLDYKHSGTAQVKVEYVGPAPLHGQDDAFLMASYKPGGNAPDPSDGLPTGVMIAMNGPTPTQANSTAGIDSIQAAIAAGASLPTPMPVSAQGQQPQFSLTSNAISLPSVAPIPESRPASVEFAALSYAQQRINAASQMFEPLLQQGPDAEQVANWWNEKSGSGTGPYVSLGLWPSGEAATAMAESLAGFGTIRVEDAGEGQVAMALVASSSALDTALRAAWAAGAADAFIVRE